MNRPKYLQLLAFVALAVTTTACRPKSAESARRDYCEVGWSNVQLFPPGTEPNRPYTIVSAVDAIILPTPARRARKMQFKACMLHADAVLDRSEPTVHYEEQQVVGPFGTVTTTRNRTESSTWTPGSGYAIRFTDAPAPAAVAGQPPVAAGQPPIATQ